MLQNARVTAVTVSELLRENQQGGKITPQITLTTQIRVKNGGGGGSELCNHNIFHHIFHNLFLIFYQNVSQK